MSTPIIIDCDPGHDDAIALLLALASPEVELLGVTTVAGNQTLPKTTTNALRVLELVDRADIPVAAGAARPLVRELKVAEWIHGESGLDGPTLTEPKTEADRRHAIDLIAELVESHGEPIALVPVGPLKNIALLLARSRTSRSSWPATQSSSRGSGPWSRWAAPSGSATSPRQPSSTYGKTLRPPAVFFRVSSR